MAQTAEEKKCYIYERQRSRLAWFDAVRRFLICEECGEPRWYLLQFHHRSGRGHLVGRKDRSVREIARTHSHAKLLVEIGRCDILCANCHQERHYFEGAR